MSEEAANVAGDTQDSGTAAATADANIGADSGSKPAEPGAAQAQASAEPAAAIEYTDFTAPEGVKLDPDAMNAFKELAKSSKLDQATAQKFIDLGAQSTLKQAQALQSAMKKTVSDWAEAAKVDKEFGGEKFAENVAIAKKGLEAVGNAELKKLLNESGIGSHPEVIRAFVKIGKLVSEDKAEPGRTAPDNKSLAETLYGTSN